MMSGKYLRRTTILFKKDERFDEELLEMLGEITPSNNFSPKLKELAYEYLKLTKPKVYEEVVKRLDNIEKEKPLPVKADNLVDEAAKKRAKENSIVNGMMKNYSK